VGRWQTIIIEQSLNAKCQIESTPVIDAIAETLDEQRACLVLPACLTPDITWPKCVYALKKTARKHTTTQINYAVSLRYVRIYRNRITAMLANYDR
jgi:hypothetical protein